MHQSDSNMETSVCVVSELDSEYSPSAIKNSKVQSVTDSADLMHRERIAIEAQEHSKIEVKRKQMVTNTKPYDSVVQQLTESFN